MRLGEEDADAWIAAAPIEDRIVSYADKRGTQRVVSLDQRFERWHRAHPDKAAWLDLAHDRARRMEAALCEEIGVAPNAIERLRWVDEARDRADGAGARATARR
jgi:hypothetical protein